MFREERARDAHRFAVSPPVHRVRRCFGLPPGFSFLSRHKVLRPPGVKECAMRPTDVCHLNEQRAPATPCVPGSLKPLSRFGTPRDNPRLPRGLTGGTGVFTTPEPLRPHSLEHSSCLASCLRPRGFRHERRPVRPTALDALRPLTPLSRLLSSSRSRAFARAWPNAFPYGFGFACGSEEEEELPRSPGMVARECQHLNDDPRCLPPVGTLRRSPVAVVAPVPRPLHRGAMKEPLDDVLTSPWVFLDLAPFGSEATRVAIAFSFDASADV